MEEIYDEPPTKHPAHGLYTVLCTVPSRSVGNARNRLLPRSIIEGKHIAHNGSNVAEVADYETLNCQYTHD